METILNEMLMTTSVAVGGAVAVVAFLGLAKFPRSDRFLIGVTWLFGGMFATPLYLSLALRFSLSNPLILFLIVMVTGLPLFWLLKFMEPSNQRFRWWGLYAMWLYVWFAALVGWRAGWLGLLLVTAPALVIAGGGLFFVSGFLLPFPEPELYRAGRPGREAGSIPTFGQEVRDFFALIRYPQNAEARKQELEQRRKALRCLLSYALGTNYPYYVVIDEKIAAAIDGVRSPWLTEEEKLIKRLEGDLYGSFLAGPGIILTGCDHAVVLSTGQKFKGARGPGIILTEMSESPTNVIDLRVQLRAFPVEAWTKDGIAIKVFTFTPFQIGTGNQKPELGKGFPYRASDVFKAVHAQLVEHVDPSQAPENVKQLKWYDLPEIAGERIVRQVISRYEFDELYTPFELHEDFSQHPRARIGAALRAELEEVLPTWGLQRIGSGISNLMPVDEDRVIGQRIEAWQTDWARKIMLQQAEGQYKRLQTVERARAQAQIDFVMAIGERIEQLRAAGSPIRLDAIVLYFIEILEKLARMPGLSPLLPLDTESVFQRARQAVVKELTNGEEE